MPTPRSEVAVAAVGGKIYVVGGFEGDGSTSDAVEVYDPVTDTWTQAPPLPEPRHHAAAIGLVDRFLYVIGGFGTNFSDPKSSVYRFDASIPGAAWEERAPLATARGALAASTSGPLAYAIGGFDGVSSVSSIESYDLVSDVWRSEPDMLTARDHLAAAFSTASSGGDASQAAFVFGGRVGSDFGRNLATTEMFFAGETWSTRSTMPTARSGIAAAQLPSSCGIAVFGGEGPEGTFDTVESYDSCSDEWQTLEPMPTARHGLGAAVVGDTIYVIGGGETPGLSVSALNEAFTP
jgi:N-acetylneuraminic acid mutarotase